MKIPPPSSLLPSLPEPAGRPTIISGLILSTHISHTPCATHHHQPNPIGPQGPHGPHPQPPCCPSWPPICSPICSTHLPSHLSSHLSHPPHPPHHPRRTRPTTSHPPMRPRHKSTPNTRLNPTTLTYPPTRLHHNRSSARNHDRPTAIQPTHARDHDGAALVLCAAGLLLRQGACEGRGRGLGLGG